MWQCLHWRNFSTTNEKRMPVRISSDTETPKPDASIASGMRWMNASPNSPPTEKLTRYRSVFSSCLLFSHSTVTPIREMALMMSTLANPSIQVIMLRFYSLSRFINSSVFFNKTLYVETALFNNHEHRKPFNPEKPPGKSRPARKRTRLR